MKHLTLLILLLSCEKSDIKPVQSFRGEYRFYNAGREYMIVPRVSKDGTQRVIIKKNLITWINDSTFIVRP